MEHLPLIHWSADPVFFSLGPIAIHWYGLCWAAAFIGGEAIGTLLLKKIGRAEVDASALVACAFVGSLIGARLAHCLIYDPAYYLAHPLKILEVWEGGLASHGGAVGFVLGLWFGVRRYGHGIGLMTLLDIAAVPAVLGGAFIRLGNFINSEIVGNATGGAYGVVFDRVDALPRHPVQLYEAIAYLLIFIVLALWAMRRPDRLGTGAISGALLLLVFGARLVLEHWKTPQAAYEAGFAITVGQWLSLPFIVIGLVMLLRPRRAASGR